MLSGTPFDAGSLEGDWLKIGLGFVHGSSGLHLV